MTGRRTQTDAITVVERVLRCAKARLLRQSARAVWTKVFAADFPCWPAGLLACWFAGDSTCRPKIQQHGLSPVNPGVPEHRDLKEFTCAVTNAPV